MNELLEFISTVFDLSWLDYELIDKGFTYKNPYYKNLLFFLPILFILYVLKEFFINKKAKLSSINKRLNFNLFNLLRYLSPIVLFISFAFFIIALARPQKTNTNTDHFTEGIDIMLTLDISGSMEYLDFKPNRLEAAKKVCSQFIEGRKVGDKAGDNIGLVVFAGEAYSKTPLTTDYSLLQSHLKGVTLKDIENQGTAIGNALAISTSRIRKSEGKSKIIVLISDGENSAGNIEPISAAQLAYAYGIRIYTIGIGKYGKVPYLAKGRNPWTGEEVSKMQYAENSFNETQLKDIAKIGNGKYFRATNSTNLNGIFDEINNLEKSQIKSRTYQNFSDFFHIYIFWGLLFLFIWMLLKASFITNAIHD